ncbi:Phosphatidylinositol 3,4,5-trisphosphate-dependent Rac exchanger 2 protein [Sorochytrium milnesiophthora]
MEKQESDCVSSAEDEKTATPPPTLKDPLVWIDCEMTGLDLTKDVIIEIACIITNGSLSKSVEGPNLIVHQPPEVMDAMGSWCAEHHAASGLTAAVLASTVSMQDAESQILGFIQQHVPTARTGVLAGNSVHADKRFLEKDMPRITDYLHYRIVDVSTLKELSRRWYMDSKNKRHLAYGPQKKNAHRALDDIRESIEELRWYKKFVFVPPGKKKDAL